MRRKLLRVGRAWRLLVALILALCLVLIGSSPVAALSVDDYFEITYEPVEFSKAEINGSEIFYATIAVTATRNNNDLPLNLSPSEALITGRIIAEHQATGAKVTLNPSYTVEVSPFPQKGETTQESKVVSLQFPEESQSGIYTVVGELIEAKIQVIIWWDVTSSLPSSRIMGSVTYVALDGGGGGGGAPPPTIEEVKTNLFGTEASLPISDEGVIQETIVATSEDETLTLTIEEGITALDEEGEPLETLTAAVEPSPPEPPEEASIIGLAYDFGPDGATFDPPITLTRSYDPGDIPEGVAEGDLVLAWYDEAGDRWVELDGVVDTSNNTITASIEHFTTFVIIGAVTSEPESAPEPEVPVAVFRISELDISPGEADIGQTVTIRALVTNSGNLEGTYQVSLEIDNKVVETQEVTLAGGASDIVIFKISENIANIYSVNINGLSGSFVVKPAATSGPELAPVSTPPVTTPISWPVVYGVVVVLVAMGALLFFLARRRHTPTHKG